jgi:recombinational DNA repair ATPase RecF
MIQIRSIHIEEFRGIRSLDLDLSCRSFAVWGPNGSGKSGVVDAIDFALTGNIARLSGTGTTGISVTKHGPHVHQRDNAGAARVAIGLTDPQNGQQATLERCVKTAAKFTLTPDTPEMHAAVEQAQRHPELILSRREIIKYIVAEAGKRAQEVQALLKLDRLDEVRRLLKSTMTKTSGALTTVQSELDNSEAAMLRHLDIPSLLSDEAVREINTRRVVLGLEPIEGFSIASDILAGVSDDDTTPVFDKAGAGRDLETLVALINDHPSLTEAVATLDAALGELGDGQQAIGSLRYLGLVQSGLDLIEDAICPLCDHEWPDVDRLRAHVQSKLDRLQAVDAAKGQITQAAAAVSSALDQVRELARTAQQHATAMTQTELARLLQTWGEELGTIEAKLSSIEGCFELRDGLRGAPLPHRADLGHRLSDLITSVSAIPDQSAELAARSYLTIGAERWGRVRSARAARTKAAAAHTAAKNCYDIYSNVVDEKLTALYKAVEDEFARFYRQVNADDESSFTASLEPSSGKLDLAVDFYGLGKFPPAAYHSEGHQDGMGVCLYLALVQQLLNENFRLAVLDDVVMSVDADHRRQFCRLLREVFPNVQFIITTHDKVWAQQMQMSGLIDSESQAHFRGWDVDRGPAYDAGGDVWASIASDIEKDDISTAAARLRRFLEEATADIAQKIQGRVPYRPDGDYDFGEFLGAVNGRHGDLLKKASKSANAWGNAKGAERIEQLKAERSGILPDQQSENWAINKLVHYNEWATMSRADFEPVVEVSKRFLAQFRCEKCGGTVYVAGRYGDEDALRCSCGAYNLNMRSK